MATLNNLIIVPFMEMVMKVASFIPTIVGALFVLVIGMLLAKVLYEVIARITKEIHINTLADKIGLAGLLHKGGVKPTLGSLIGSFVYLVVTLIFFIMTLSTLGMTSMTYLISTLLAYVPQVVSAVFVLVIGMILAKVISTVVYAVTSNLDMPKPKLHERISRWAILLFAAKVAIEELGYGGIFVGTVFHIWFSGLVLALALAYGIRGHLPVGHKK